MPISANNHQTPAPELFRADPPGRETTDVLCPCGHRHDQHDSISIRYCDVTASAGLDRGCICHAVPGNYPGRM